MRRWIKTLLLVGIALAVGPTFGTGGDREPFVGDAGRCYAAPASEKTGGENDFNRPLGHGTFDTGSSECNGVLRNC